MEGCLVMKRSLMQAHITGSDKAVAFDAIIKSSYLNSNGTYIYCELDIQGHILTISERNSEDTVAEDKAASNTMQFSLHYGVGSEDALKKAYEALKENAEIIMPLGPCEFSPLMADLIDMYGIRWCLFV